MDFSLLDLFFHLDRLLAQLASDYGVWLYPLLFAVIFCETGLVVMPFLPGDSLLFVAGALAAQPGNELNVHLLALLLLIAAISGDALNYLIGRRIGMRLFANPQSRIFRREYLDRTHAFYERHGGKTIVFARFVPIVRTFAPFVAGVGEMQYSRFFAYNVIGALAWVVGFLYAGYLFGNLPLVRDNLSKLILLIIVLSILPGVIEIWRQRRRAA
ncbi:DedA family protein [Chitinimonas lacunae]|uniref:DedA family protein n=1 Tax=Chitinimonas lacunae TaxID=1963018 RepID=A0ABV8MRG6_9NEIS